MDFNYIILASASPRRQELLKLITDNFTIEVSAVEEVVPKEVSAEETPEFLAMLKAKDVAKKYPESLVIGADTCVLACGKILGKPKSEQDAFDMLSLLSGKVHTVFTGCALVIGEKSISFSVSTEVEFYKLSDKEIWDYIASDEPFDKAGAYGIQGKGSLLVKQINGDYFNVVGLPVSKLNRVINSFCNITK